MCSKEENEKQLIKLFLNLIIQVEKWWVSTRHILNPVPNQP